MMEYRGTEYAVVEGIGRHMWKKWSAFVGGAIVTGQAHSKQAAIAAPEKAIVRGLAVQKVRLVRSARRLAFRLVELGLKVKAK
jgi:hypothetical protein